MRVIRNLPDIHSWGDAQSFRRIPNFDGKNYRQKEGSFKLKAAKVEAYMFHYGWTRPPKYMQNKRKNLHTVFKGEKKAAKMFENTVEDFDYGALGNLQKYMEPHPAVLEEKIKECLFNKNRKHLLEWQSDFWLFELEIVEEINN